MWRSKKRLTVPSGLKLIRKESDILIVDSRCMAAAEAWFDIVNDITGFLGDSKMAVMAVTYEASAVLMFNPVMARPHHPFHYFSNFWFRTAFKKQSFKQWLKNRFKTRDVDLSTACLQSQKKPAFRRERIMLIS